LERGVNLANILGYEEVVRLTLHVLILRCQKLHSFDGVWNVAELQFNIIGIASLEDVLVVAGHRARNRGPIDHPSSVSLVSEIKVATSGTCRAFISHECYDWTNDGISATSCARGIFTIDFHTHSASNRVLITAGVHGNGDGTRRIASLLVIDPRRERLS